MRLFRFFMIIYEKKQLKSGQFSFSRRVKMIPAIIPGNFTVDPSLHFSASDIPKELLVEAVKTGTVVLVPILLGRAANVLQNLDRQSEIALSFFTEAISRQLPGACLVLTLNWS